MNTRLKILLVAALVLSVTITMRTYIKNAWPLNSAELLSMTIALMIVLIGITVVLSMLHAVKTNQPLQDEMTTKLAHTAGYYTWIATIYIALAIGWVIDDIPGMMPSTWTYSSTPIVGFDILYYLRYAKDPK